MLSGFVWNLNNEKIMETFQTTKQHIMTHCVIEKIDDFRVVSVRIGENEFLSSDKHDVIEQDVVSGVIPE